MDFRFNLKQLGIFTAVVVAVLALAKYENMWVAWGTFACLAGWLAVGKLSAFFYKKLDTSPFWRFGGLPTLTPILQFVFVSGCVILIVAVLIAITNAIREESANIAGPVVSTSWLVGLGVWTWDLILWRSSNATARPN